MASFEPSVLKASAATDVGKGWSCARRFLRPRWIASSPVCASSHVADASKTQNSTFLDVDLAGIVRVELPERVIQTLRLEQEL